MRKSRFTESQIVAILHETDSGMKVRDICRKHGVSDATFYNWKSKYGGMNVSELRRMKELEAEKPGSSACTPNWHWKTRR